MCSCWQLCLTSVTVRLLGEWCRPHYIACTALSFCENCTRSICLQSRCRHRKLPSWGWFPWYCIRSGSVLACLTHRLYWGPVAANVVHKQSRTVAFRMFRASHLARAILVRVRLLCISGHVSILLSQPGDEAFIEALVRHYVLAQTRNLDYKPVRSMMTSNRWQWFRGTLSFWFARSVWRVQEKQLVYKFKRVTFDPSASCNTVMQHNGVQAAAVWRMGGTMHGRADRAGRWQAMWM